MSETLKRVAEATVHAFALIKIKYGLPDEAYEDFVKYFDDMLTPKKKL